LEISNKCSFNKGSFLFACDGGKWNKHYSHNEAKLCSQAMPKQYWIPAKYKNKLFCELFPITTCGSNLDQLSNANVSSVLLPLRDVMWRRCHEMWTGPYSNAVISQSSSNNQNFFVTNNRTIDQCHCFLLLPRNTDIIVVTSLVGTPAMPATVFLLVVCK
jgi:hypothetical protein